MSADSYRHCLNCGRVTRWHVDPHIHHSRCTRCGMPSIYGVKRPISPRKIAEREDELRFMMAFNGPLHV